MISALWLPASKSTALPLACREGRPLPVIVAPGLHVDTSFTGPNFSSMRSSSARAGGVKQVRDASGGSRKTAERAWALSAAIRASIDEVRRDKGISSLARYMRLTQPLVDWCWTGHHSDRQAPVM